MKKNIFYLNLLLSVILVTFCLTGCSKDNDKPSEISDIWDIDKNGIPQFVETNYIELDKIYRITKFRSSWGHDYSDAFEHCRSMKHYYEPKNDLDWTIIKIYSPVTGIITRVEQESAGIKIEIASDKYPAFRFSIFHIYLSVQRKVGDKILAGDQLGTHVGTQTLSDISVIVNDPTRQGRMVSYFDVMTDNLFNEYKNKGINTRADIIISKEARDADPLSCNGEIFTSTGSIENWVVLK